MLIFIFPLYPFHHSTLLLLPLCLTPLHTVQIKQPLYSQHHHTAPPCHCSHNMPRCRASDQPSSCLFSTATRLPCTVFRSCQPVLMPSRHAGHDHQRTLLRRAILPHRCDHQQLQTPLAQQQPLQPPLRLPLVPSHEQPPHQPRHSSHPHLNSERRSALVQLHLHHTMAAIQHPLPKTKPLPILCFKLKIPNQVVSF